MKQVFIAVCDLDPINQRKRLEELCGADLPLLREVEQLLANDLAESLFDGELPAAKDEWIGRTLQNYKILERIGEGGMGVVYLGEDARLKRPVAVKFLATRMLGDRSQRERFLREAQAAASLDHPSICTVYDIGDTRGQPYIVTAYLEGETLEAAIKRGNQSFATVLDYAIQLAEGLQAAHAKGIVHRDLKPSNVILAPGADGRRRATIIDFGLARVGWGSQLTQPGRLIGTANYICPQLLQGEPIEEQSDIWSLGVILYEMLAGHAPFDADNRERLFYLICHESPAPLESFRPELPREIGRIAARALEKDSERRYATMGDFLRDLRALQKGLSTLEAAPSAPIKPPSAEVVERPRAIAEPTRGLLSSSQGRGVAAVAGAVVLTGMFWFGWTRDRVPGGAVGSVHRIAVMPFEDLSVGERNERVSRTLGESLAVRLAGLPNVRMVSTSTVRDILKGGAADHEVSSRLRLDYLVTGHVERSGNTLRVTSNLISGKDYTILSSKKLDLPWSDILTMQNQFAESASREVASKLPAKPSGFADPKARGDAYDQYLKARYSLVEFDNRAQPEFLELAEQRLKTAIDLDPHYSDALAEMANAQLLKLYPPRGNRQALLREAKSWIDRTFLEDPTHLRANGLMSSIHLEQGEQSLALEYARRAVRLAPGDGNALHHLEFCYSAMGFFESALVENEKVIATDVPTMRSRFSGTWYLTQLGRPDEAKKSVESARAFDRKSWVTPLMVAFLDLHAGNFKKAEAGFSRGKMSGLVSAQYSEIGEATARAAAGDLAFGKSILRKHESSGDRGTEMLILLAAVTAEAETMARLSRDSAHYYSYGWLTGNGRFFKRVAGKQPFRDLAFDLHKKWEADLAEIGPTLPVRPSELPGPEAFLASLR